MPIFSKSILKSGTYNVGGKQVYVSPERVSRFAETFRQMRDNGLKIPAPYHHDPKAVPVRENAEPSDVDAYRNAGFWTQMIEVKSDDGKESELIGVIDAPRDEDADRIGKTVTEVSPILADKWVDGKGNEYKDAITHVALVTHPIQPGQENFIAMSHFLSHRDLTGQTKLAHTEPDGDECPQGQNIRASNATIAQALPILQRIGLSLPADTTEENFAERVIVAALAIEGHQAHDDEDANREDDTQNPPPKSKEKPSPIAMANTPKPNETPEAPQLTPEQNAQLKFANDAILDRYKARIEALVHTGRAAAKYAQETLVPMLNSHQVEFSAEGKLVPGPLDTVLTALEAIPESSSITGKTPTGLKRENRQFRLADVNGVAMSQHSEIEIPEDEGDMPADIDGFIDAQFQEAGIL